MCGIAAILLHPQERPPEIWRDIKHSFVQNLVCSHKDFHINTRLALFEIDGKVIFYRVSSQPSEFARSRDFGVYLDRVKTKTTLILGNLENSNSKDPTTIDEIDSLDSGVIFGVHNSHIKKDDFLLQRYGYSNSGSREAVNIFRMSELLSIEGLDNKLSNGSPQYIQKLQGRYAFLSCNRQLPEKMVLMRTANPLFSFFHQEWNALIFSSCQAFLIKSFGHSVVAQSALSERLSYFDANCLTEMGSQPVSRCELINIGYY